MYNRYIPQNDGTYRRSHIPDPPTQTFDDRQPEKQTDHRPVSQDPPNCRSCVHHAAPNPPPCSPPKYSPPVSIGSFLKQLLPARFDTEDMLIVILLLLMAGDSREEPNFALLTLALYLFL